MVHLCLQPLITQTPKLSHGIVLTLSFRLLSLSDKGVLIFCHHRIDFNTQPLELFEMAKPKRTTKANKLTEFTIFRKLAPELRNMIWELVPEANVVEIWAEQEWTVDPDGEPKRVFGLFASYKVPAVLQVSREARIVALKCFTKIFEAQTEDRTIYFNTDLDVLSIRNNVTFQCLCSLGGITLSGNQSSAYSPIMNKLRRLQFGQDPCWFLQENKKRILSAFGKPELVVMHHKSGSRRTHYSFEVLKQDIEQNWGNEADKNGDKYKPELHVLTALQLAKMLVSFPSSNRNFSIC